ncbi:MULTISPECIES: hypothetical protein [unclassified Streptomyces]|uniref:hypothetical protein n=1 Tax=unclassified Streptomyces TaxID=2593676 RepID=UPI00324BA1C6|nr:hypothetical protein OG569_22020 [Streptomyces sp. NBC_00827]
MVEVLPEPPADVIGYLGNLDWPDGVGWDGVFDRLRAEPPGPVAEALSTPLMVTTARLVYRRGAGTLSNCWTRSGSTAGIPPGTACCAC